MLRTILAVSLSVVAGIGGTLVYQRVDVHFWPAPAPVPVVCPELQGETDAQRPFTFAPDSVGKGRLHGLSRHKERH